MEALSEKPSAMNPAVKPAGDPFHTTRAPTTNSMAQNIEGLLEEGLQNFFRKYPLVAHHERAKEGITEHVGSCKLTLARVAALAIENYHPQVAAEHTSAKDERTKLIVTLQRGLLEILSSDLPPGFPYLAQLPLVAKEIAEVTVSAFDEGKV